ncbi:conserved hypothetical protein [Xenorhabdus bovienii str. kraussei Quebec]|uniref:Uncharacterized protein n=1 Tax=Xenorhabdus bovienii str. kraussei Quebec TaxID=1398203 RepID=A0A077PCX9_XENBV|nr:conserved hypothetical protein [Xenorhabdus bovienii str. kraussei Quebec]
MVKKALGRSVKQLVDLIGQLHKFSALRGCPDIMGDLLPVISVNNRQ